MRKALYSVCRSATLGLFVFFALPGSAFAATTWDATHKGTGVTLSNGNLTASVAIGATWQAVKASASPVSGKWYWEIHIDSFSTAAYVPVGNTNAPVDGSLGPATNGTNAWGYNDNGHFYTNGTSAYTGTTWGAGDTIGVAYDATNGRLWWSKNGVWQNSGDPAAGTGYIWTALSSGLTPMSDMTGTEAMTANFGASAFSYTVPSGFSGFDTPPGSGGGGSVNFTAPTQGIPYQYAVCTVASSSVCMQYAFITATTTPGATTTPIVPYGGADFYEWLLAVCVIIIMLAPQFWRAMFAPVKDMYI